MNESRSSKSSLDDNAPEEVKAATCYNEMIDDARVKSSKACDGFNIEALNERYILSAMITSLATGAARSTFERFNKHFA